MFLLNRYDGCFTARQNPVLCGFLSAHQLQWCVSMTQVLSAGAGWESLGGHLAEGWGCLQPVYQGVFYRASQCSPYCF